MDNIFIERLWALDQVRRSASESLRRWLRGAVRHQFLDKLLQFSAPSPGDEQPDADGGVARRHGQNRGGGEGCGYAASLGQRKRVAHIPTAEAARSGLILEGQRQARLHLKFNDPWSHEWGPVLTPLASCCLKRWRRECRVAAHPVVGPIDVIGDSGAGVLDANLGRAALAALAIPRERARARALTFSPSASARQLSRTCSPYIGPPRRRAKGRRVTDMNSKHWTVLDEMQAPVPAIATSN